VTLFAGSSTTGSNAGSPKRASRRRSGWCSTTPDWLDLGDQSIAVLGAGGAEDTTRTVQNRDGRVVVAVEIAERPRQGLGGVAVDGVANVRSVQGDRGDGSVVADGDRVGLCHVET
jgi:hypothetical protein